MTQPFRIRHADRLVAGFLLAVLAVVAVAVFLVVRGQGLFKSRHEYKTVFSDGGGLKPESPVRIAGIEVGSVRAVTLTPDNKVEVVFDVLDEYADRLRADPADGSCTQTNRSSMMDSDEEKKVADAAKKRCGSRVAAGIPAGLGAFLPTSGLIIQVGNSDNPLVPPGGLVPADEPEGLSELLARLQKEGIVQSARDIVIQIDELLRNINDPNGHIQQTLSHVEEVAGRAAAGKGLVGEITRDGSPTQRRVGDALASLEKSLAELEKASADVAAVTASVRARDPEIQRFIDGLDQFAADAKVAGKDIRTFSKDIKELPPDLRNTIGNLNRRIDDLGDIITGLKRSFPLNMVVEEPRKKSADKAEEKK